MQCDFPVPGSPTKAIILFDNEILAEKDGVSNKLSSELSNE